MSTTQPYKASLYLDGKLFETPEVTAWNTFQELCQIYTLHLGQQGRAIRSFKLDGVEIDTAKTPDSALRSTAKIEVESCLLEELIRVSLDMQCKSAQSLTQDVMELSTDCLIQTPMESFEDWKIVLEDMRQMISFVPTFFMIHGLMHDRENESFENDMTHHIQEIQNAVDVCRKAWDAQDVVLFSDTLELRICHWLKSHETIAHSLEATLALRMASK